MRLPEVLAQLEADGRLRHDDGADPVAQLPVFEFEAAWALTS